MHMRVRPLNQPAYRARRQTNTNKKKERMASDTRTPYVYKDYVATLDTLRATLQTHGVAIMPAVLNTSECDAMASGVWDAVEFATAKFAPPAAAPVKRDDPSTFIHLRQLFTKHSMLHQHFGVGHAQAVWDVRQHPRVAGVFANLWQTKPEDLLVSFDGFSLHVPPEQNGNRGWYRKPWMHVDQSYTRNGFECVQGWVTAHPVEEGDATLAFLRGSHAHHGAVADACNLRAAKDAKKDWRKLEEPELAEYAARGCAPARVRCPAGSLVLWDSRTVHCGVEPEKGRRNAAAQRCVVYVCMQPRARATPAALRKKRAALEALRMTSHWAAKPTLFPLTPRTYGAPLLPIQSVTTPPTLTPLGRRLAGCADTAGPPPPKKRPREDVEEDTAQKKKSPAAVITATQEGGFMLDHHPVDSLPAWLAREIVQDLGGSRTPVTDLSRLTCDQYTALHKELIARTEAL